MSKAHTSIHFKQRKGSKLYAEARIWDKKRIATGKVKFSDEDVAILTRMFASVLENRVIAAKSKKK